MSGFGSRAARAAYSLLLRIGLPLYLLRVLWRGRAEPLYSTAIGERIGRYRHAVAPGALWIHAVSLGETRAAAPLIVALRQARPGLRLLLTHGTATGRAAGRELLRDGDLQAWLPWDTPGGTRRFLGHFAPAAGVLMETEIWPNVLAESRAWVLPVMLANARLSERSRRRGQRVDALLRPAFSSLAAAFAQTEADAARLREAGVGEVVVAGNLKFDLAPEASLIERGRRWKASLGARPVVLAAVTREGEEASLLAAWRALTAARPLLVVVPRHPQRFDEVAQWADTRRSRQPFPDAASKIHLGDTMGEMAFYFAACDVAVIGGSFLPLGGQNLIEALACGAPVIVGPSMFNFAEATRLALEAGAAVQAADPGEALREAMGLLRDPARRAEMAAAGKILCELHRGATARHLAVCRRLLSAPG